jgi:hypothetical protein
MKKLILLQTLAFGMIFFGCNKTDGLAPSSTTSGLVAKVSRQEVLLRADNEEQIVFTGNDILWFNASTKEMRFKNNFSHREVLDNILPHSLGFYIDDEYLFSSLVNVSNINSQIFDSPVFYYDLVENRFYLNDGYPDVVHLQNSELHQSIRDENMARIQAEWGKFADYLKREGKWME